MGDNIKCTILKVTSFVLASIIGNGKINWWLKTGSHIPYVYFTSQQVVLQHHVVSKLYHLHHLSHICIILSVGHIFHHYMYHHINWSNINWPVQIKPSSFSTIWNLFHHWLCLMVWIYQGLYLISLLHLYPTIFISSQSPMLSSIMWRIIWWTVII